MIICICWFHLPIESAYAWSWII